MGLWESEVGGVTWFVMGRMDCGHCIGDDGGDSLYYTICAFHACAFKVPKNESAVA